MPKIRNKSGEDRAVPGFGVVKAGEILEVAAGAVGGFTCQAIWEPVDKDTQDEADKAARARKAKKAAAPSG